MIIDWEIKMNSFDFITSYAELSGWDAHSVFNMVGRFFTIKNKNKYGINLYQWLSERCEKQSVVSYESTVHYPEDGDTGNAFDIMRGFMRSNGLEEGEMVELACGAIDELKLQDSLEEYLTEQGDFIVEEVARMDEQDMIARSGYRQMDDSPYSYKNCIYATLLEVLKDREYDIDAASIID